MKTLLLLIALALPAVSWALDVQSYYPGISSAAHMRGVPGIRLGNPSEFPTYAVGIVNEPDYFTWRGTTYQLPPYDPNIHYDFVPLPNGNYQFQFALGRSPNNGRQKLFFGFEDSMQVPVPIDSHTTVNLNLVGAWHEAVGKSAQRVTIGVGVDWNGRTNWVEINPYAQDWDWCGQQNLGNPDNLPSGACDTAGIYDRRSYFGSEIVEYTVHGLGNYPRLVPGAGWTTYLINWGELIRAYPWQHPPADWSKANIVGVYVGIESQGGNTWAYLQVRDFATVTF